MQALSLDEHVAFFRLETVDDRPLPVARIPDLFECIVILYVGDEIMELLRVRPGTSHLAGPAPDAPGGIDQDADEFGAFLRGLGLGVAYG
jgi:hypothetical protein